MRRSRGARKVRLRTSIVYPYFAAFNHFSVRSFVVQLRAIVLLLVWCARFLLDSLYVVLGVCYYCYCWFFLFIREPSSFLATFTVLTVVLNRGGFCAAHCVCVCVE